MRQNAASNWTTSRAARYKIRVRVWVPVRSRTREVRDYFSGGLHLSVFIHSLVRPRLAMAE